MAANLTNYAVQGILNELLGGTAFAAPATIYVGLGTDSNTATQRNAGTITEVGTGTWTNYARVAKTNNTTNWPAISSTTRSKTNGTTIDFGAVTATGNVSATVMYYFDAASAGNLLAWEDLTGSPVTIANGNTPSIAASAASLGVG